MSASRLLGRPLPERVAGIDLFTSLLAAAGERGESIYILGASRRFSIASWRSFARVAQA